MQINAWGLFLPSSSFFRKYSVAVRRIHYTIDVQLHQHFCMVAVHIVDIFHQLIILLFPGGLNNVNQFLLQLGYLPVCREQDTALVLAPACIIGVSVSIAIIVIGSSGAAVTVAISVVAVSVSIVSVPPAIMVPIAAVPVIAVIILSGIAGSRIAWAYGTRGCIAWCRSHGLPIVSVGRITAVCSCLFLGCYNLLRDS